MNTNTLMLCLLYCVSLLSSDAWAEPRTLKGRVIQEAAPGVYTGVELVTVILRETGSQSVTDSRGMFRLYLGETFQPGEPIHLDIQSNKNVWRLQFPLNGEINVPANLDRQIVDLHVSPVKSKRFWTSPQIEGSSPWPHSRDANLEQHLFVGGRMRRTGWRMRRPIPTSWS